MADGQTFSRIGTGAESPSQLAQLFLIARPEGLALCFPYCSEVSHEIFQSLF